jgi:hypothetical protein
MPVTPATHNACDLLDADHIAVKHLFVDYARLAYAPAAATGDERLSMARRICEELTVHAQIEEEIFYPALEEALPDKADVLDEGRAEHQKVKKLMARIEGMASPNDELDKAVADLACLVENHVKEERDELFPGARSAKGLDLHALAEQLRVRQQQLVQ